MNYIQTLTRPDIFSIDKSLAEKYPSIVVGIAIIKGISVNKSDSALEQECKDQIDFLLREEQLTTEKIGAYPEIQSYRRIYKEMGLDYTSKRPSPEALLRRIVRGQDLYQINTCVDAYNLVVLKNRLSSGAFDLDCISLPTVLRYAKEGEEILLLGDSESTKYKSTDIAYFDQNGGYNTYFNYRDAQRTAVTEKTKNIFINIEGIFEIKRAQVEKTLNETIEMITRYCSGNVEVAGIVEV